MNHVIRRIVVFLLCTLALAGCGATDTDVLSLGDQSISEEGFVDLVVALNQGDRDTEIQPLLDVDGVRLNYRDLSRTWLSDAAAVEYLSQLGITITEADRENIKPIIEDAIANPDPSQRIGPIARSSEGYEALVQNVWVASHAAELGTPEAREALVALVRDADLSSRIGSIDPETLLITARG